MNKNLLIGICAVAIILVVAFVVTQSKEVAAPTDSETPAVVSNDGGTDVVNDSNTDGAAGTMLAGDTTLPRSVTVTYNGNGFVPETVTVIQGGSVTFVNDSDVKMWIGSNNHPTHTQYPVKSEGDCLGSSFDECAAVDKGGEWTYTFTEAGTWGYHNHMRARNTGTVVVQTEEEYLSTH